MPTTLHDNRAHDPLGRYVDGGCISGSRTPIPLTRTRIDVRILGGLAIVRTGRCFRNDEPDSIEATITFPVPVHATVLGLSARLDGRVLTAQARRRGLARARYEQAIDDGRLAVLHEEAIRGIHMLSVGHVPPGGEILVESVWAMALERQGLLCRLRIPTTVGDLYGRSPLPDSDDLVHAPVLHRADLSIHGDSGRVDIAGAGLAHGQASILLDRPIDIVVTGWQPRVLTGQAADGRRVQLEIQPADATGDIALDAEFLLDQSGSMAQPASSHHRADRDRRRPEASKHDVMVAGLQAVLAGRSAGDALRLWQFDTACEPIAALEQLWGPRGGTEIGLALAKVAARSTATDIGIVTDGKSHAIDVQALARTGKRFSVVLIGEDSLDARIGHLAALTGGQLFIVSGTGAVDAIAAAIAAMRRRHLAQPPIDGAPHRLHAHRAGMDILAGWHAPDDATPLSAPDADARIVGAFAAVLAIAHLPEAAAADLAEAEGIACHLTSLVLVDEAAELQPGLPSQRKVPLMTPRTAAYDAAEVLTLRRAPGGPLFSERVIPHEAAPGPKRSAASRTRAARTLHDLARRIDWSDTARLSQGELTGLSAEAATAIVAASQSAAIARLAGATGLDPVQVVIGLLARSIGRNRNAARIFRALLGQADARLLDAAIQALGL